MKESPDQIVVGILSDAYDKYRKGEKKHGVIDLDNDPRNFLKEAEDELLDAIVYMAFEIARIRALNERANSLIATLAPAPTLPPYKTARIEARALSEVDWDKIVKDDIIPALERAADRNSVRLTTQPEEPTL